jgi:hypothetical protein
MEPGERPTFREEQRLRQWWIIAIILAIAGLGWWAFLAQIVGGEPWGSRPAPDWAVWLIFFACGVGLPLLILLARLVVTVTDRDVRIRWIPFARKTIPLADVESAEARTYRPIREYGGWGIRWRPGHGTAWNASGDRGVELVLANGKKVLIGSQRAEELEEAIRSARARGSAGPTSTRT